MTVPNELFDSLFADGYVPTDEPEEREYRRWKAAGGTVRVPTLRIRAELVCGGDLKAGDLFSTGGPEYWQSTATRGSIGERVYIRTESPIPPVQAEEPIYRLTIERL